MIATNTFFISRKAVASNWSGSPLEFRIKTKATFSLASHSRKRCALSGQYVVRSLRNDSEPPERATPSRDVSGPTSTMVHQAAWSVACSHHARPVSRHRKFSRCGAALRGEKIYRVRNRRDLSRGSAPQDWDFHLKTARGHPEPRRRRGISQFEALITQFFKRDLNSLCEVPRSARDDRM